MSQDVEVLIKDITESYYEYVLKIAGGCEVIIMAIEQDEELVVIELLDAFEEGIRWIIETEILLAANLYQLNRPIDQSLHFLRELHLAIEIGNLSIIKKILKQKCLPFFSEASEWHFEKVVS